MEERPPPSPKIFIFPAVFALGLATAIHFIAPQVGNSAALGAGFGAFFMLSIWGWVTR